MTTAPDEWVGGNPNTADEAEAVTPEAETRRARRAAEPEQSQPGDIDMDHVAELIEEVQEEEVFDFLSAVEGIQRPTDTCTVFLDEKAIYTLNHLLTTRESDRSEFFDEEVAKLRAKIAKTTYVFHLVGLSVERQKEIEIEAEVRVPIRYTQIKMGNGSFQRQPLPNPELDDLKNVLKWSEMIEKVVNPNGTEVERPGERYAEKLLKMPPGSIINFQQKVMELEVASMGFEQTTDATFPRERPDMG